MTKYGVNKIKESAESLIEDIEFYAEGESVIQSVLSPLQLLVAFCKVKEETADYD